MSKKNSENYKGNLEEERKNIIKIALLSRVIVIILQLIGNKLIPDHHPKVFHYVKDNSTTIYDKIVDETLGGFLRWDGQYFMHIAKFGYTYENSLAFFPFYPYLVYYVSSLFNFFHLFTIDYILLFTFISINIIFFILSAITLHKLSLYFMDQSSAFLAVCLFCFNPASIFFSAPYTECIFSYLSFQSMLNSIEFYKKYAKHGYFFQCKDLIYIIPTALSTLTRSNGVLNIGFSVFVIIALFLKHYSQSRDKKLILKYFFLICVNTILSMIPFILFQYYCYNQYCTDKTIDFPINIIKHAKLNNFVLPGKFSKFNQSWCYVKLPLAYAYVQTHYWEVGFLKYFTLRQIPQFILATPIVYIIIKNSIAFFKDYYNILMKNGLFYLDGINNSYKFLPNSKLNPSVLVFVVHATFLTLFCFFNIHVQVTTRMLFSASPIPYWYSMLYFPKYSFKKWSFKNLPKKSYFILLYFLGYFILGIVLFCNYLPWT